MPVSVALAGLTMVLFGLSGCANDAACADTGCLGAPPCPDAAYDEDAMYADVAHLAAPELDGRVPGTDGDSDARALVNERFACLGLSAFDGSSAYDQPFTDSAGRETANVLGYLPGDDPDLSRDLIVISAHTDHLGDGRLGANDNASGVSGLLAIAQEFASGPPSPRTLVFAALGSEEIGMEGAAALMDDPPDGFEPSRVVYNVNMDMIGSYSSTEIVYALGALQGTEGATATQSALPDFPALDVGLGEPSDQSDNVEFCRRGIPYLFFWTEDLECYHEACDTIERLDTQHMVEIARLTGSVTGLLAASDADLRGAVRPGQDVCGD